MERSDLKWKAYVDHDHYVSRPAFGVFLTVKRTGRKSYTATVEVNSNFRLGFTEIDKSKIFEDLDDAVNWCTDEYDLVAF